MKHTIIPAKSHWNRTAAFVLPGRGGSAVEMARRYARHMPHTMLVAVQPDGEWYPSPKGPMNQEQAVQGLQAVAAELNEYVADTVEEENISTCGFGIVGYSAGGVVALQSACTAFWKYAAVVCHSGCVLSPSILKAKQHDLKIYLHHGSNDQCFSWEERHIPTRVALSDLGYNVVLKVGSGGHELSDASVQDAAVTLGQDLLVSLKV